MLEDLRDIVIIAAGSLSILVLMALLVFTVLLGLAARALLGTVNRLLNEEVTPLVNSAHLTVKKVHGTASFIGETTASPVIRVYGMFAGARRAVGVVTGLAGRRGGSKKDES